ncbi:MULTISPECIES: hypothetical protein [Actinosynnema]|uniref:hypothetical protein n=1 Tax=Actinosynnema TaxID=40566 RepID=UPI0020A2B053|nr:hypothetical protein [Actinosynnema pretiosum]MCP2097285.1 hypothetical protein [Actinosynnema pretiosum]
MWWVEALAAGFDHPVRTGRVQLFRLVFGTVLALRFALALGWGGWSRLVPGSLEAGLVQRRLGPVRARLLLVSYRPMLLARLAAALALATGLAPKAALVVAMAGLAMETGYLRAPAAVRYSLLLGACLLTAGDLGHSPLPSPGTGTANTWAQCLIVLVTTDLYWNSAYQKICSPQFRSGLLLAQTFHVHREVAHLLPPHQNLIPTLVLRHAGGLGERDVRLWRAASMAAIVVEIALPPALLLPQTAPWAVAAGVVMHAVFTCLKPRHMITFTGITLGSYLAFTP